jgi:anhydro-N-acetylmuramic acid kinase
MHNPLLMQYLKEQLADCIFNTTEFLGIDPDAKEAVLFAVLANECICGDPLTFANGIHGMPAISMGKISFPF